MSSNFEIVSKAWKAAKFNINIVRIPEAVINDKLAILSDGTGMLSFSRYERFLLNSCVVEPDRIYKFLETVDNDPDRLVDAAVEVKNLIIEVNPLLDPEILVITNENRIKIPEQSDKPGDVRRLVENPSWEKPEFFGKDDDDDDETIDALIKGMSPPIFPIGGRDNPGYGPDRIIPVEWKETELLVLVIQHDVSNIPEIFKDRSTFTDEAQYKLFIVTRCIHDFQNLFILVDRMGATKNYGPEKITDMLYKMCIEHNRFLSWEEIDLDKVNRAVLKKYGKRRRDQNLFKKKTEEDPEKETGRKQKEQNAEDFYKEFEDLSEEDILSLPDRVKKWVIGQNEAVDKVCETVQLAKCGLKEQNTPIGSFMFTGQSGIGKTWCSRKFAQELCGDEHSLIRIDCSEYSQPHEVSKLIGAAPSYVGYEEGGYLTNAMMKKPFSVVLFDEIEKAHPKLHNILLQIMDEGRLTSNKGETVSFGSALIVMTSNIGVKEVDSIGHRVGVGDTASITHDKRSRAIEEALKNSFKPEFLNRLDGVITFKELGKEEAVKIIELAFKQLNEWLGEKGANIVYTKKAADYIYSIGFKPEYGARPLKRAMRKEIMLPVSKLMLQNKSLSNCTIKVGFDGEKLTFEIKNKTASSKKEATKPEATKETGEDDVL